jgi:hypothetical protein
MTYTLKIYDMELMTYELTQKPLEGFCCQIVSVNDGCKHLLPSGMTVDGNGVLLWLKSRFLPANRANSDRVFPFTVLLTIIFPALFSFARDYPLMTVIGSLNWTSKVSLRITTSLKIVSTRSCR